MVQRVSCIHGVAEASKLEPLLFHCSGPGSDATCVLNFGPLVLLEKLKERRCVRGDLRGHPISSASGRGEDKFRKKIHCHFVCLIF